MVAEICCNFLCEFNNGARNSHVRSLPLQLFSSQSCTLLDYHTLWNPNCTSHFLSKFSFSHFQSRKALKVVDLKAILTEASVTTPAKANKNDLIARIIASPAALAVYNKHHPTPGSTPAPSSTTAKTSTTQTDDLLAPPEECVVFISKHLLSDKESIEAWIGMKMTQTEVPIHPYPQSQLQNLYLPSPYAPHVR